MHHYKMEPECQNEKHTMIELISVFKKFMARLIEHQNISKEELEKDENYQNLKKSYLVLEESLIDSDYFYYTLGDNFEES